MPSPPLRLVVLDRDGVINRESADFIRDPGQWIPLPGSLDAIASLTRAGFTVAVATNQSGVGRGLFTGDTLAAIHAKMTSAVEAAGGSLAGIFVCPHHPDDGCECRKPKPGLLRQIEQRFATSLAGQPIIGDSARDIQAARAVSGRPILVRTGNGRTAQHELAGTGPLEIYQDLRVAAEVLIRTGSAPWR